MSTSNLQPVESFAADDDAETRVVRQTGAALSYRSIGDPFPMPESAGPLLRIGLCSSLSRGFLRDLIRHVRVERDAPSLSFMDGTPREIMKAASRDEIDVGFVYGPHDWASLVSEEFWREQLMVLAPDGSWLSRDSQVKPAALRGETFLVAGGLAEREMQAELLERAIGGAPAAVLAVPVERSTVIDLVSLGFGLAVTVESALGVFHPGVSYKPIASPVEPVAFHAVWRGSNKSEELARFLETARALAALRRA
jgi:DNA-binding transcriptional LysR family regulator